MSKKFFSALMALVMMCSLTVFAFEFEYTANGVLWSVSVQ